MNECNTCNKGYYYYSTNTSCLRNCPDTMFKNTGLWECTPCNIPCGNCESNADKCLTCNDVTYHLYHAGTFSCLDSCPSGTFDNGADICETCTSPCATCIILNFY